MMIHNIDGINTIINIIKSNIAKGFIVKPDQTLEKTYLVKQNKFFAHGKTLKEALKSLEKKIIANLEPEEVIEKFLDEVDLEKKYTGQYFFDWHGKLTGSCLQGRETFIKNNGIKLTDKYTVFEFIELVKNEFGGEIIKMLEDRIKEVKN
ncbi:MAG: hypothetical protein RLZZ577_77 [Bacteroidota bacterium]|jgi:hypothetical protein